MGFRTDDLDAMVVKIDHTNRENSGFSSLQVYLRQLEFSLADRNIRDQGVRSAILREWNSNGGEDGEQLAFVESYLLRRFAFKVTATPYDGERYPNKPTLEDREGVGDEEGMTSYPFYTYVPVRGGRGPFPWTWERVETFAFSRISTDDPISFDVFGWDSVRRFSGGATRPLAEEVLNAAPGQWVGQPPMYGFFLPRLDGIIITVEVVDLAASSGGRVATLEDYWGGNFFGSDEDDRDPRRLRRELQR